MICLSEKWLKARHKRGSETLSDPRSHTIPGDRAPSQAAARRPDLIRAKERAEIANHTIQTRSDKIR